MIRFILIIMSFFVLYYNVFAQESSNFSQTQVSTNGGTVINNYNTYNNYYGVDQPKQIEQQEQTKQADKKEDAIKQALRDNIAIGYNFTPNLMVLGYKYLAKYYDRKISSQNGGMKNTHEMSKDYAFSISLDIRITKRTALSADIGYAKMDAKISESYFKVKALPWSVGIKIFPGAKGLSGFFLYPKVGGISSTLTGDHRGNPMTLNGENNIKQHGIYGSMELGWRIKLFPNASANWPIRIGMDISLLDIGYYFTPWNSKMVDTIRKYQPGIFRDDRKWHNRMKLDILPRIGFSIIF